MTLSEFTRIANFHSTLRALLCRRQFKDSVREFDLFFVFGQSTDLVSMVYSCIGAEIEDSDGSSTSDIKVTDDTKRSTTVSDAPADTRSNGHVLPSKQQTERQMEAGRQERIVPLTDARAEVEEDGQSVGGTVVPGGPRPEPPPQSTKPGLAVMRQRHLQESLGTAVAPQLAGCMSKLCAKPQITCSILSIRTSHITLNYYYEVYRSLVKIKA